MSPVADQDLNELFLKQAHCVFIKVSWAGDIYMEAVWMNCYCCQKTCCGQLSPDMKRAICTRGTCTRYPLQLECGGNQ